MKVRDGSPEAWQHADPERFWQHIAREQHILQIYKTTDDLLKTLFTFVDDGLKAGDSVLIIATSQHRQLLDEKLEQAGHNVMSLRLRDQYICLDASATLSQFMVMGMPEPLNFRYTVSDLIKRAKKSQRRMRVFGEMVAILWSSGNHEGAVALEHLWNIYLDMEPFTLLCAYPETGTDGVSMFEEVHHAHRRCVAGHNTNPDQVVFKSA
jgi:hypothetical protein